MKSEKMRVSPWFGLRVSAMGAIALLLAASVALAQSPLDVRLLTPREYQRLSKKARKAYDEGVKALDHIDPITAIAKLDEASKLAPEAVNLHFLTARLALIRARMSYQDEASKYYKIAEQALERVGKIKKISPLIKHRYETQLKVVQDEMKKVEVRDAKRKAIGIAFCKIYAKERYESEEKEKEKEKKAPKPPQAPGAAPPPVQPRVPAGGGADSAS